jgi:dephospho-CoA kinase
VSSRPLRVALTGGIATGKSHVLGCFSALGAPTIDADQLAHDAISRGTPGFDAVLRRFGPDVLDDKGDIDRAALGRLVFGDPEARRDLEAIIHPQVYAAITRWFEALPRSTAVAIADIPLLFETGREKDFDIVIVVAASPETQLERVRKRGFSIDEARQRVAAQMPIDDKRRLADYVIETSGSVAETNSQVADVWHDLMTP